ncbi:MAG TPA: DapH/DapD/GlmU-related protein [Tepidisphaeraceae bacterium]|nr:DapH/DapD/GlmU-related protein [Tepidisphaeraceae bacterium]
MTDQNEPNPAIFQTLDKCDPSPYTRSEYKRRFLWSVVQATLFRVPLMRAFRWRNYLLRLFGAQLAKNCNVHFRAKVVHPWLLEMGEWSNIGPNAIVYNMGQVTIGSHSVVSQDVYICAGTHDYTKPTLPLQRLPIRIGNGVWIAAGAFIGPGSVVGDNSVIGARAVVVGEVPPGVVSAGNPARPIAPRPTSS